MRTSLRWTANSPYAVFAPPLSAGRFERGVGQRQAAAVAEPIAQDHLDRPGDRDGGERPDDTRELGADEDGDQHCERGELDRAAVDDRLQERRCRRPPRPRRR